MKIMDIWHWSWCLPQTLLGYLMYKKYKENNWVNSVIEYRMGTILIRQFRLNGGRSLGKFVFTHDYEKEQDKVWKLTAQEKMDKHEYGHAIQSMLLGPFYLFIIGLPSISWHKYYKIVNKKKEINYYKDFYTERWADKWGKVKR